MRFCSGDAGAVSSLRAVQTSTTAVDDGSERRASSPVRTRSWYRFCHCVSRVPRSCGRYIGPTVLDRKGLPALFRISLWGLISVIGIPLLSGTMPEWGAAQMRTHLPALVGWITYGASCSLRIGRWRCQSGFYKSITSRARLLLVLEASLTKDNDSYEWDRSGCTALDNYIRYDFDTSAVACGMLHTTYSCCRQNIQTS